MAEVLGDSVYMTGGRGTHGVGFAHDVWRTANGTEWELVTKEAPWGRRGYHILLPMNGCLYLMGGQTFTTFYNDVWKTCDGEKWEQMTAKADWPARAGLGGTYHNGSIVIAGGCHQVGLNRDFWGDVWRSTDGVTWQQMTAAAPWSARSGPRLVSFKEKLFIIAGERGFTPDTQLGDIWSSADSGATWDLVIAKPAFSARSGHGVVLHPSGQQLMLIAGWPELHDMWTSVDAKVWTQVSTSVWGCTGSVRNDTCGMFDFWSLQHKGRLLTIGGSGAYATFGQLYANTWSLEL